MTVVCRAMKSVLAPNIWIAFAERTGIPDFRRATRDDPDFDKLKHFRSDHNKRAYWEAIGK